MAKKIYTDEIIAQKLKELYPSGIVKGLSKDHKSFYNAIQLTAKEKGMSNKEYIKSLGFLTKKPEPVKDIPNSTQRKCNRCSNFLADDYDGKTCPVCKEKRRQKGIADRKNREANNKCKKCGKPLPKDSEFLWCDYCRELGKVNVNKRRDELLANHCCEDCGIPLPEYYSSRKCPRCKERSYASRSNNESKPRPVIYTDDYITELLMNYYENNQVNDLQNNYPNLYHAIYRKATDKGISVAEYVESLGFKTKRKIEICSTEGCGKKHYAKGYCQSCYKKYRSIIN